MLKIKNLIFFILFLNFLETFKSILFNILIKLLIPKKKINNVNNFFYCFGGDLVKKSNYFIDKQYGNITFSKKKNISYIINLNENINLIKNVFKFKKNLKKIPCDYYFLDHYLSIIEIFKIHFFTLFKFIKFILKFNKKKYFTIRNIDCSFPLKNQLIESFLGNIQSSLISGISTGKFVKKSECKNLISYLEFYPMARSTYYFSKFYKRDIKLISVNHANYSKENLFFNLIKKEFSKKNSFYVSKTRHIFMSR